MSVANVAKRVVKTLDRNSPAILTGLGIAGVVSTSVLMIQAGIKTGILMTEDIRDSVEFGGETRTKKDLLKDSWEFFIPAIGMGVVTVTCILGAQSINSRRQAALISGFTILDNSYREYRDKFVEMVGPKQEQKVRDAIAQDKVTADPPSNQVFITGTGETLCKDSHSGRYFKSDMETLRRAENAINRQCINDMYASVNDFYRLVGLPINGYGEELGWNNDSPLELVFSGAITEDGQPCISFDYRTTPIRGYNRFG